MTENTVMLREKERKYRSPMSKEKWRQRFSLSCVFVLVSTSDLKVRLVEVAITLITMMMMMMMIR